MERRKKAYHHGNLKETLIRKGIELINTEGEESLSLRRVAQMSGVSNAAPYTHFKNKEELLDNMSRYILDLLAENFEKIVEENREKKDLLAMIGKSYVMFFYNNPQYYKFLFSRKSIKVNFITEGEENKAGNNKPFNILKREAIKIFSEKMASKEEIENELISMWALVQGLSSLIIMENVKYEGDWEEKIEDIIKSNLIRQCGR